MKRLSIILFLSAVCTASASPFYDKVTSDQVSPNNDILVQHYFERGGTDQIWLVSTADPSQRHLLFTHDRSAELVFSDDEKWLVINNHSGSSESFLLLFRQKASLEYEQVADLTDAAWKFFEQQNGQKAQFDHYYVEALRWADDDPPTLLVSLKGHMDSHNYTSEWYCFYNVQTKTFSTDLAAHNRKMTALAPR